MIEYVRTNDQLADILTKEMFTTMQGHSLFHVRQLTTNHQFVQWVTICSTRRRVVLWVTTCFLSEKKENVKEALELTQQELTKRASQEAAFSQKVWIGSILQNRTALQ